MSPWKIALKVFYAVKPLIPRRFQLWLRRRMIARKMSAHADVWPILEKAAKKPDGWIGWPDQKKFAFVLTHDVELQGGHDKCRALIAVEKELGFVSSFNFVPERYVVSPELRKYVADQGFEVGVHGLNHDGKLFQSRSVFSERAPKINRYIRDWKVVGFRSPAMHRDLDWIRELDLEYDLSTFDTDPFEANSVGVETIFPFRVEDRDGHSGYIELPYTLAQDFTPFILMREKTIDIWKKKLDWIAGKGGMALLNVHPDYLAFDGRKPGLEEFPVEMYQEFLNYVKTKYAGEYWHVLPRDLARFWNENMVKPEQQAAN